MSSEHQLVLTNARPRIGAEPTLITIEDGKITAIGPEMIMNDPRAEIIDVDGRVVLPGLWDHHVHFDQWSLRAQWLDLSGTASPAAAVQIVRDHLKNGEVAAGSQVTGYGYRDGLWDRAPHRAMLDEVTSEIPIVLVGNDLHQAWLNSAALRRYGLPDDSDGILREDSWHSVMTGVRDLPDDQLDRWAAEAAATAARRGVVGIVDFEKSDSIANWQRRMAGGLDSLRVAAAIWPEYLDSAIEAGYRTGQSVPVQPGPDQSRDPDQFRDRGLLEVGPLKVITDGSMSTRTAYCDHDYQGGAVTRGMLLVPADELEGLMARAWAAGIESAIHAIGDHANALVLSVFAKTGARGVIEHAQLVRSCDFARFAELGVGASVQPAHVVDDRDTADEFWPGQTGRSFAYRSLLDAGARLTFGSDAPVSRLDPWAGISAAVTRTNDSRPSWHPEQRLDLEPALAASTRTGASQLRSGDVADLIVVDDLTATADDALADVSVGGTMIGGRWTWRDGF